MARARTQNAGQPSQLWMLTFSDCMTLLLTFFVLLLTFSSFSDQDSAYVAGALRTFSHDSIFSHEREIRDSAFKPVKRPTDVTEDGSEKPAEDIVVNVKRPKELLGAHLTDVHKDRKVLYLACPALFWGEGTVLSAAGREKLAVVGRFMKNFPCHVIIAESRLAEESQEGASVEGMERALAVMDYLTAEHGVSDRWLTIASTGPTAAMRLGSRSAIQITLLARGLY